MAWDYDKISEMLDSVANTKDHASVQAADQLLDYLATKGSEKESRVTASESDSKGKGSDICRTDGK